MTKLLSALEELNRLYQELHVAALASSATEDTNATVAVSEAILRHRNLFLDIEKAHVGLSAMTETWSAEEASSEVRQRCRELAATTHRQAEALIEICRQRALLLESGLAAMRENLKQIDTGSRYLRSAQPAAAFRPRFIDSVG